jgi:hypothetical protein
MRRYRCPIGITALGLSFLALLFSVLPSCLIERKLAALEQFCADKTAAFSFTCDDGGCNCQNDAERCAAEIGCLHRRLRLWKFGMAIPALAAVCAASWSWRKERAKELCLFGIASASVALSWQHVGALAAVGLALTLFIVLAARLGQD